MPHCRVPVGVLRWGVGAATWMGGLLVVGTPAAAADSGKLQNLGGRPARRPTAVPDPSGGWGGQGRGRERPPLLARPFRLSGQRLAGVTRRTVPHRGRARAGVRATCGSFPAVRRGGEEDCSAAPADREFGRRGMVLRQPARPPADRADGAAGAGRGFARRPGDHLVEQPEPLDQPPVAGRSRNAVPRGAVLRRDGRRGRAGGGRDHVLPLPAAAGSRRGTTGVPLADEVRRRSPAAAGGLDRRGETLLVGRARVAGGRRGGFHRPGQQSHVPQPDARKRGMGQTAGPRAIPAALRQRLLVAGDLLPHPQLRPADSTLGGKRVRRAAQSRRIQPRLRSRRPVHGLREVVGRPAGRPVVCHQWPALALCGQRATPRPRFHRPRGRRSQGRVRDVASRPRAGPDAGGGPGRPDRAAAPAGRRPGSSARTTLRFRQSGWFLVRAVADNKRTFRFASTAPFYVEIGAAKRRISGTSARFFLGWVEERMRRVPQKLANEPQLREVLAHHERAKKFWQDLVQTANAE